MILPHTWILLLVVFAKVFASNYVVVRLAALLIDLDFYIMNSSILITRHGLGPFLRHVCVSDIYYIIIGMYV